MPTGGREQLLYTSDGRLLDPWFFIFFLGRLLDPLFFGFFVSIGAFVNAGFSPLPDSLMRFSNRPMVFLPVALNIFIGATAFPIVLRTLFRCSAYFSHHIRAVDIQLRWKKTPSEIQNIVLQSSFLKNNALDLKVQLWLSLSQLLCRLLADEYQSGSE
eukprot:g49510.t1